MINRRTNSMLLDLVSYQQETFQRVVGTTMNAYVSLLRIPLAFTHAEVNAAEAARQQATQVAIEEVKQLAKQAAQQATEAAIEQVKQLAGNGAQQATKAAGTAGQGQLEQA